MREPLDTTKRKSQSKVPGQAFAAFPATRYQGSKRKLLPALAAVFEGLELETALDPFCGTGSVAYLLKTMGKAVTASDILAANAATARALIENDTVRLGAFAEELVSGLPSLLEPAGFIERVFDEVFYERDENRFLDGVLPRIHALPGYSRDLALHALCQACLVKRPYNLFHRANLSMRRRDVVRSFGNKTTWERPFSELFLRFAQEVDRAVCPSVRSCRALQSDVLAVPGTFDLVYLDPPYVSGHGVGVDYLDFYHFLEGLCQPEGWEKRILSRYRHKPLAGRGTSPWADPARISGVFEQVIARFAASQLVISYRSDGIPAIDDIVRWLTRAGKRVQVVDAGQYVYTLSRNTHSRELIVIAR